MRILFLALAFGTALAANAQFYGNGNTRVGNKSYTNKSSYRSDFTETKLNDDSSSSSSPWDMTVYGLSYLAKTDHLDKGSLGISMNGFMGEGHPVGMTVMWNGIYNLATEKFMDSYQGLLGPNFNFPVSDNVILYAPLCLSVSMMGGSDKVYWGAAFIPSLGLKFGNLFLSAGWNLFYDFSAKKDNFNSELVAFTLGFVGN